MSNTIICLVYDGQFHSIPTPLGYNFNNEITLAAIVVPFFSNNDAEKFKNLVMTTKLRLMQPSNLFEIIKEVSKQKKLYYVESPTQSQLTEIDQAIDRCKKGSAFSLL